MNIAVILAGGVGKRMGTDIPKQFIEVLNKPIIIYTLERFEKHPEIDAIEIVCIESHINYIRKLISDYDISKVKWVVSGGETFQESVFNGINNLKKECTGNDNVLIHMSVSPFVEDDIISDSLKICNEYGNAISANPCLLCMAIKTTETNK